MNDRSLLGCADISDVELTEMAAAQLGQSLAAVTLLSSAARVVPYDIPALTTVGRYSVSGRIATPIGERTFRFFVKHIQSSSRSALFAGIPEPIREAAAASVPWRTEALIYRSDLAERLPPGIRMPPVHAVRDLDDQAAAIWMDEIQVADHEWTEAHYARAAYLGGRIAASPRVGELSSIGETDLRRSPRVYAENRLTWQVLPMLRDDAAWESPLLETTFGHRLRQRLALASDLVPAYLDELEQTPLGTAHGDFCPNNLLMTGESDGFVLIDFGFWSTQSLGFDLTQLVIGNLQIGVDPPIALPNLDRGCVAAYARGLEDEGARVPIETIRRAHALLMLLYAGLSAPPFELLDAPQNQQSLRIARQRAAMASYALDLVDETRPITAGG